MSDQNLEYQLEILVDDADKRMQALFKSWEKAASNVATSFAKGLADAAKAAGKADGLGKMFESPDKAIAGTKKLTEAVNQQTSAVSGSTEATAKSVNQQNALWTAVDKADASLRKQADALRGLGAAGAAEEVEKLRTSLMNAARADSANIGNTGTALPRLNVTQFLADNRQLIQGYDDQIKKEREVSKTSVESHAERIRQAEKLNATEAQIRATRYSDNAQFQSVVKAQEAETAAFLANLRTRSVGMTKSQVEAEIVEHQRLAAAKISLAAEGAQAEVNAQYARTTQMNKATMAVYAVQQAVEDFSYAGMKGAMNNLSFLAMMIGGTGGLVALFGAMALNVGITSGALDGLADSLGLVTDKTKEQNDELKKYEENLSRIKSLEFDANKEMIHFDPANASINKLEEKAAATKNDIELERERANAAAGAVAAYKEMLEISKQLGGNAKISAMDFGIRTESPETILNNIDAVRQYGQFMFDDAEAADKFYKSLDRLQQLEQQMRDARFTPNAAGFEEATKKSQEFNDKLNDLEKSLETINKQLATVGGMEITTQGLKELEKYKFSATGESYSGMAGKNLSKQIKEQQDYYERRQVELEHERAIAIEKSAGNEQKKLDAIKQYVEMLNLEKAWGAEAVKNAEANAAAQEKTVKAYEAAEHSIKKQIADTERLLEVSEKQLQNLIEQKSAWEDSEAKRKAAALDKIDDLKFEEKKEAIDKKLKEGPGGLEWAKQRKEYLKDLAKYQLDTMKQENGNGKGAYDPDKQLQQQYDAYIRNLDREYEAYVKNLEKKAEADKKAAEKATNSEKQKRLDQLKEDLGGKAQDSAAKAAQLQAEGKWDQAKSELEKSMKALKELHDAQQKAVGKVTSEQSIKAEKEMDATSKKINGLYDNLAAIETARQEQAKQQLIEQQKLQQDIIDKKAQAASINMANPADVQTINALNTSLERTLALMQAIKAVQAIGASPVGGRPAGVAAGGAAGGVGNTSINITNNLAGGSALSANLAAAAAAQSLLIMRR